MPSLREALHSESPALFSARAHAARIGLPPYSLREVILASDRRELNQTIVTPPGTALGGWVKLVIAGDGRWTFSGHMHGSGFDPYDFSVHAYLQADRIGLSMRRSGGVGGTIGGGSRDHDWTESGVSKALRGQWKSLREGNLHVVKSYENTGVLGVLEDIGEALCYFVVGCVLVGPAIAGLVVVGSELMQLADVEFGPEVWVGVMVAAGMVLLCGPGMVIPAIVAGVAAASTVDRRHLNADEETVARSVFADSLDFDRIYLTNISSPFTDRAFCTPMADGSILVNVARIYDAPILTPDRRKTFIHELVHAWQTFHGVDLEAMWQFATNHLQGHEVYEFTWGNEAWSDMNLEAQASAVAAWFSLYETFPDGGLSSVHAINSPLYDYVANHIRLGQN